MRRFVADLRVTSKTDMESRLSHAVAGAIESAEATGRFGVLVTRHNFSRFTVEISPGVPFRLVRERDMVGEAL
jgi:hypothetical protein